MAPEKLRIEAVDEIDLDSKFWTIRERRPGKRVVMGPIERLPIKVKSSYPTRKITAENTAAATVEIYDATDAASSR